MTFRENVVMRLVGLFIFIAPERGANFMADVTIRVNENLKQRKLLRSYKP